MKSRNLLAREMALITFAVALLVSILVLAAGHWERSRTRDKVAAPGPLSAKVGATREQDGFWYIRIGQWRADGRTAFSLLRYLLEEEVESKPFELAMPTNSAPVAPKV